VSLWLIISSIPISFSSSSTSTHHHRFCIFRLLRPESHRQPVMSVCCTDHNPYTFLFRFTILAAAQPPLSLLFLYSSFCLCVGLKVVCGACCRKSHRRWIKSHRRCRKSARIVRGGQRWLRRHGSSVRGTDLKTQRE
jgi:hypothetical protein